MSMLRADTGTMNMLLMQPEEPSSITPRRRLALWELGFRPFYLLAAMFAAPSVLL